MTVKSSIFFGVFPVFLFALCRVATADTGPLGFGDALFDQEMETDRPDFTEGTQAVQSGHFQLELGYSFVRDSDSDTEEHAAPESLLRIGLMSDLELRLAWDGYRNLEVDDSTTDGVGDMSVGFKYRFTDQTDSLPALGLIV